MMTDEERIAFAVRFVQMDLAQLRPGDWLNLREELTAFVGVPVAGEVDALPPLLPVPGMTPHPSAMTPDEVQALQEELRACFRLTPGVSTYVRFGEGHEFGLTEGSVIFNGTMRDLFFAQLLTAFLRRAPLRLHRCPICETLFLTRRAQLYCSRPCSNRAAQRRFRTRQTAATSH